MTYEEFIARKAVHATPQGFEPDSALLRPHGLFDWQSDVVGRCVERGRSAIFADCGMGKTPMQLAWSEQVTCHTSAPVLILAPLAVSQQTRREGEKFGVPVKVCRSHDDVVAGINITNYEMLDKFDTSAFSGVVLDESSILKSFMGKTKRAITDAFAETPYRLSCTATPSPNDLMELLNQADFLGIMHSNEALSEWFIADQSSSGTYRLKGHAEDDFWRWVASWAVALTKPSDIGYPDDGYRLPALDERDVLVDVDLTDGRTDKLFRDVETSATAFNREKRRTLHDRCAECARIARQADGPVAIWCYLNAEADELRRIIPDAVDVRGSDAQEHKEQAAMDFADGKIPVLISKPSIFGFGMNFQGCHETIFCGLDYSYESYYQAVRRFYRFGQRHDVTVWRVLGKTEENILNTINRKAQMRDAMESSIVDAMRKPDMSRPRFSVKGHVTGMLVPEWVA